ncbi:MAG: sigma-70 family RNA polymerase sigma factor [Candidatus Limnocylindrales bacterium]
MDNISPESTSELTAEHLIGRVGLGDLSAVGPLYERLSPLVFGLAMRTLRDRSLAEDVVQETFVSAWRNAASFDSSRGSAKVWVLAIARHCAIDTIRRRRPTFPLPDNYDASGLGRSAWVGHDTTAVNVADITNGLAALPTEQRSAVDMSFLQGRTHPEIAARTGLPLGTVKSRVRLGLLRLRESCAVI